MNQNLTCYALAAANRGWHVFPLTPHGKKPLRGFDDWETHATADLDRIAAFWPHRPYNVGIACGPSGLVVIDLDLPKPGEHPPADVAHLDATSGEQVFRLLCDSRGQPYPDHTFTVRTRSGGLHLYFTAPPGARLRNTAGSKGNGLGWLIDTRAHGGYVAGPGSHVSQPDGTGTHHVIRDLPPAPLPGWLTEVLTPPPPPSTDTADLLTDLPAHRLSRYGHAALHAEATLVAGAPGGHRNQALNRAAFNLGRLIAANVLPEQLVISALTQAAQIANHRVTDREPATPREIAAVIASGMAAGKTAPPSRRRTAA